MPKNNIQTKQNIREDFSRNCYYNRKSSGCWAQKLAKLGFELCNTGINYQIGIAKIYEKDVHRNCFYDSGSVALREDVRRMPKQQALKWILFYTYIYSK